MIKQTGKVKGSESDIFQKLWGYIRTELGHRRVWLSKLCWQSATFTQDSIYKVLFTLMMFWWCARSHTTVRPVTCISSSASSLWPWCLVLSLEQYLRLIHSSRRVAVINSLTVQQIWNIPKSSLREQAFCWFPGGKMELFSVLYSLGHINGTRVSVFQLANYMNYYAGS